MTEPPWPDLTPWLSAQLDGDERIALAAKGHSLFDGTGIFIFRNDSVGREECVVIPSHVARFIGRIDPDRVLREVEANRRILTRHQPVEDWVGGGPTTWPRQLVGMHCSTCRDGTRGDDYDMYCGFLGWPCPEILDVASTYADRPGYREEWRPT